MPTETHYYNSPQGKGTKDHEAEFLEFQKDAVEKEYKSLLKIEKEFCSELQVYLDHIKSEVHNQKNCRPKAWALLQETIVADDEKSLDQLILTQAHEQYTDWKKGLSNQADRVDLQDRFLSYLKGEILIRESGIEPEERKHAAQEEELSEQEGKLRKRLTDILKKIFNCQFELRKLCLRKNWGEGGYHLTQLRTQSYEFLLGELDKILHAVNELHDQLRPLYKEIV